ncbi:MAG: peptidoglycan DD-metalloendopeptidase family protein [Candidatus Marinimicrobia bacterium]|nr:peptidoglycan DD-metalloendopeptidase family protein [Candidatus Neomarinimicrobiota bacterium]
MKLIKTIFIFFFAGLQLLFSDSIKEYDVKIQSQNDQLQLLEKEIGRLQKDIKDSRTRESSVLDELDRSSRQIQLLNRKIRNMEGEMRLRKEKLKLLKNDRADNENQKDILLDRYKKRIVRAYKIHNNDIMELLFTSKGMKQFYYRLKYINAINQSEKKLYHDIRALINAIDEQTALINTENKKIKGDIITLDWERIQLAGLKKDREKRLKGIRKNKNLYSKIIRDKESSLKQIQKFISRLEKEKKQRLSELERQRALRAIIITDENSFEALKGKLPWPVPGRISSHFGKHRHPVLKTMTENTGIDIAVREGSAVQSIMDGLVTTVTWLRGYGNTIIIHHGEDYYTVYTRVSNVVVSENEYVTSGQIIAEVDAEGLEDKNVLHFEIWDQQTKLNPEKWLRP